MDLRTEARDPWAFVLAGLAGGLGWAVGIPVAAAVGVGAAVYGVRVLAGAVLGRDNGSGGIGLGLDGSEDARQVTEGLDRLLRSIRKHVPADIYSKVESIRGSILLTMTIQGRGSGSLAGDPTIFLIRQTALDYLPAALEQYLALPPEYAERPILADGRTPHAALAEQLDLMDRKMREVADDMVRHDTDRLVAHGRFLQERFGSSAFDLRDGPG